jgi:hypothetical protein
MAAIIIDPTPIQPLWRRFGREYTENGEIKTEWFPFDPDEVRPPSANVYQENYAALDPASQYVRKRQFPNDPSVWTSEPFSGALWPTEFSPKCRLADLQLLPTWHKATEVAPTPIPPPAP